jgi:tetratricopeptide (TPR) repeat protein
MGSLAFGHGADGDLHAGVAQYVQILARPDHRESRRVARALQGYPLVLYWLGRPGEGTEHGQQIIQMAQAAHDICTLTWALPHLGLVLAGSGRYREATFAFAEARRIGAEYQVWSFLPRAIAVSAGFHLDVFDFAGNEALAEEARELARSVNFAPSQVSAGIDLLLNFARRREPGRAEKLVEEVAEAAERVAGWHGWLWRIRLAEARAELALARGDGEEALRWASEAIAESHARGRVKYEVAGLGSRGQALAALGRAKEAIAELRRPVAAARPVDDPAMFLGAATALLAIEGDDALAAEARSAADRIAAALPDEAMRRRFEAAAPVRRLRQ